MDKRNIKILVFILVVFMTGCTRTENVNAADPDTVGPDTHAENAGPTELWNSFTADMNQEQVIARAREVLQVTQGPYRSDQYSSERLLVLFADDTIEVVQGSIKGPIIRRSYGFRPAIGGPGPEYTYVRVYSPMLVFNQESTSFQSNEMKGNIKFYFYHDKLYAVEVLWNNKTDILQRSTEHYGNPTAVVENYSGIKSTERRLNRIYTYQLWELSDKMVALELGTFSHAMTIIDLTYIRNLIAESERRETAAKAEEEAKRRSANEGVVF
jgi:hypothetical protein